MPAWEIDCQIRGLSPHPGAFFLLETDKGPIRIKALASSNEPACANLREVPGKVLDAALLIACGQGAVRLHRVQREGKQALDAAMFLRGGAIPAGKLLS